MPLSRERHSENIDPVGLAPPLVGCSGCSTAFDSVQLNDQES